MLKALFVFLAIAVSIQAQGIHDPQFKKSVPCSQLSDGNYVWGCSRFYSMCASKLEHTMNCFDELVLNPDNNHCEDPKNVWICRNPQKNALYLSKSPFTCQGHKDGDYEADTCSSYYYQCYAGNRYERECPVSLVFNPAASECDYPNKCKSKPTKHSQPINFGKNWPNNQNQLQNSNLTNSPFIRSHSYSPQENAAYAYQAPSQSQALGTPSTPLQDTFIIAGAHQPKVPQTQPYHSVINNESAASNVQIDTPALEPDNQEKPVFDCTNKNDGIYLINPTVCTQTFWKCSNARAFEYKCPSELFYEIQTGQCNHQKLVPACGGQLTSTTHVKLPTVKRISCSGKADGYYQTTPCTLNYYSCTAGEYTPYSCSPDRVFEINTLSCIYPSNCGKPKRCQFRLNDLKQNVGLASYYYKTTSPIDNSLTTTTQVTKPVFNCIDKADGYYYKKKCTPSFIICSKGQLSQQNCPEGLLFDPDIVVCQYKDECGKSQPTTTTTMATTTTADSPILVETTPSISFNCTGKHDGYHISQPCISTFFACASNKAIQLACPPTLVFDQKTMACEFPNVCEAQTTTQVTVTTSKQNTDDRSNPYDNQLSVSPNKLNVVPVATTMTTVDPAIIDFNCQGKPDGYYYKKPCMNTYYVCVNSQVTQIQCPTSLVFNSVNIACEKAEICSQMLNVKTTTAKSKVAVTITLASYNYSTISTVALPTKKKFSCANRKDGYYIKRNCVNTFYTCVNGNSVKAICPAGLVLDTTTSTCEYPDACGKQQTAKAQTPVVEQHQQLTDEFSATTAVNIPIQFNCIGNQDGKYAIGHCQANYILCAHEIAYAYSCPIHFVYDELTNICQYTENCGVSIPDQIPKDEPAAQVEPILVTNNVSTKMQTPAKLTDNSCGKIPIGIHASAPCSPNYVSCSNGYLTPGVCFGRLIYNQVNAYCDNPENIPACQGIVPLLTDTPNNEAKPVVAIAPKQPVAIMPSVKQQQNYRNY